jgi:hypothetical protein
MACVFFMKFHLVEQVMGEAVCLDKVLDIRSNFTLYLVLWIWVSIAGSHIVKVVFIILIIMVKHKQRNSMQEKTGSPRFTTVCFATIHNNDSFETRKPKI